MCLVWGLSRLGLIQPNFLDGMNPFRVWFEGWSRSIFFCLLRGIKWVGMDGTVNPITCYICGTQLSATCLLLPPTVATVRPGGPTLPRRLTCPGGPTPPPCRPALPRRPMRPSGPRPLLPHPGHGSASSSFLPCRCSSSQPVWTPPRAPPPPGTGSGADTSCADHE
jgi:hypothetical protein